MKQPTPHFALRMTLIGCACLALAGCTRHPSGYSLATPDAIHILPPSLLEVSGIAWLGDASIACVQDERGGVYTFDTRTNRILAERRFMDDADYEGIARVGDTLFVLRSDGTLVEIPGYTAGTNQAILHATGIPSRDNEGLCLDALNNRLLIAAKSRSSPGAAHKEKRTIHAFDLATRTMADKPAFVIDASTLPGLASATPKDRPKGKRRKTGNESTPANTLRPSGLCMHPATGKLYLLSAETHTLLVFRLDGTIECIEPLPPDLFHQPEGITFSEDSDLFIANEGSANKPATILRFKWWGI
jgi:uncharacterized protein YjiK